MRPYLTAQAATGRSGVAAIGVAQEFASVFTGTQRDASNGIPWFSFAKADRRVTCYYFSLWDIDFGPAFIKICAYFPVRHEAPCNRVEVRCCTVMLSQQRDEAGGSLIQEAPVRAANSPDNGGTYRYSRTVRLGCGAERGGQARFAAADRAAAGSSAVLTETARHAAHADVLQEQIEGVTNIER